MKRNQLSVRILLLCSLFGFGLSNAQNYEQVIKDYIHSEKTFQKVNPELKTFTVVNVDPSKSLNGDVVGIQQTINGIPIFGSSANVLIREGKVLNLADTFIKMYPSRVKGNQNAGKDALVTEAVQKIKGYPTTRNSEGKEEPLKTQLIYFAKDGELILGYRFDVKEKETGNMWNVIISTDDGGILYTEKLTLSCSFHDGAYKHHDEMSHSTANIHPVPGPVQINSGIGKLTNNLVLVPDNASYNVLPFPVEAPTFGSRALLNNPWDTTASPEGWHFDGTSSYTNTRGNNVYAYTDENNTNTPQFSPDGGSVRAFDFPMDISLPAHNYKSASVTNLFYVNNKVHDVFYKLGFAETARNFQANNFGKGGAQGDAVLAEAWDGGGYNNANFYSPADGSPPTMQMYLWEPDNMQNLFYNSPSVYTSRTFRSRTAIFGPKLETIPPVTANLALTTPVDGCTAINEDLAGKIALIQRGGVCGFPAKVKNAQLKGAVGVVIYNAPASVGFGVMGGSDSSITIPSVLIENPEGSFIAGEIAGGAVINSTLKYDKLNYVYKDGSLDNGIVIHEYGHGISNRLTGTGSSCLSGTTSNEQMGEGWSDFFALMLTNRPGDNASVPRGVGTFATEQPINGVGIRPAKYSPDFAVNNYTYGRTNGMKITGSFLGITVVQPHVHSIGFVWATMLWDLHWKYAEKYGYNSDVMADPNSGSARVLQLVVDALKLQQCNPNFKQGRDAILAADLARTGGQDKCMIWKVFAKRGLGVNAAPGGLNGLILGTGQDLDDQVEDFTIPAECNTLAVNEASSSTKGISIYPNPVKTEFTIKTPSGMNLSGITTVSIYDFAGKLIATERINLNKQTTIHVNNLLNGTYIVKITGAAIDYSQKIIVSK
ncbi:T9SS-dependent M36 family metallopeptidase [Chryseobacterium herbae]|uniref:T9SS-dependent M36 family metallopeptidase n=1 Tax=Chryseobacterium herbae TaxID=2976476 RepID=A0ABT2J029_9FLAO|nr:T9SS-dependent M36 family metallopeptidase [Chryseobacterium sp. pc1-10]MCT2564377.1 T9SS-dependent M36 family metallopeptidase [Chryseobacterium sp. pc1-10]